MCSLRLAPSGKSRQTESPSRLRVLHVVTRFSAGGAPFYVATLKRGMRDSRYAVMLATGRCSPGEPDVSYLLDQVDGDVFWVPEMSRTAAPWGDLVALWRLFRLMRKTRPAVVHTHTAKAGFLGRIAARLARVPVVVHTFHGNVLSGYFPPPVNWLIRIAERSLAKITDVICVVAPQQASELSEKFHIAPRRKMRVIPLGLDLRLYASLPPPQPVEKALTVGWFGRLVKVKDIPLLLAAMEETLRRNPNIRFIIAGDGPERRQLEAGLCRFPHGAVDFAGWQQDILPLLSRCDVVFQTSMNEGTPVALIEGMAARRPFVSTAVGGVVDMVSGPRIWNPTGHWFPNAVLTAQNPIEIAEVLCELSEDPQLVRTMGEAAFQFAARQYPLAQLLSNIDRLYSQLLTGSRIGGIDGSRWQASPDPATDAFRDKAKEPLYH
jgi:glycosyltransferase involved in cell wall biosynthesis